jgi:hypothetical protein
MISGFGEEATMAHKDNTKNAENAAKASEADSVEIVPEAFVAPVKSVNMVGNHTGVVQLHPLPTQAN